MKLNPELNVGDRVILLSMPDETMHSGTRGTVISKTVVFGHTQYNVKWDNGSQLALLSDVDVWALDKKINESAEEVSRFAMSNPELFKFFDRKKLVDFLKLLQQCGVTNMLGASPYLYMGKDRMKIDFEYHNPSNEICEEVLELADTVKNEMISGTIESIESKNKEVTIERVNREIRTISNKILKWYMITYT